MFLGQVISKSKNLPVISFIKIVEPPYYGLPDKIPTLIVGKSLAEEMCGKENVKVLDKKIADNVFWTFGKTERRTDFEKDIDTFNNLIVKKIKDAVKYEYYNIFTEPHERSVKFIEWLYNGKTDKTVYICDKHLYIYPNFQETVYGLSLNDVEYIGKHADEVIDKIKANEHNIIVEDNSFISQELLLRLSDSKILVPYIHFLDAQ